MGDLVFAMRDLTFQFAGAPTATIRDVHLAVHRGELVAIVGPNGSGKTTLLRLLLGTLVPDSGMVTAFGHPVSQWKRRDLARRVGVVTQSEEPTFPLRVRQAVTLGRYAHLGPFEALGTADRDAVTAALTRADAIHLADRWTATLSGGEWQRVRVARALAQEPEVLVLDEPTANLDLRHEMEVFELVTDLVRRHGMTGLIVTHHVNLAARFVDRIVVMHEGRIVAAGQPNDVLTREVLERVFAWPLDVMRWDDVPQFVPKRKSGMR